ncbi:MAG TPA: sugar phosphate isomerase/epimerase family protein [Planctomycetota bacterium]|jgi:sugar phosphate isomerase/epimerase|nr:sugar phosphate isomerase/epimerase [Planctomycetota bacterium]OQC20302.1 MAG: L-ribulose-5-phosphate 3-epimerase UlaE [Planctomycetes bacterium ADurb.Bin069]NMD34292.1 sugar phosphate isomerase/epimerase [Planctomycetota bacterium]HNR98283.1 sugar phosphate isomerase/epimerase family protein [Planctomycetota bacterium]HNU24849.1 sugar phosphate isomerase/epimerase family protein [Planctomycetota bacterium]
MATQWNIGACSWSLQVKSILELEELLKKVGLEWTQIALGDPNHASWEEDDATFVARVDKAAFRVSAAMLGFPGEDYTTPDHIRRTGGFGDAATRSERLEILAWGLRKTKTLGLDILSTHAGFIPEQDDPARGAFMDTLRRALDAAEDEGITLAFETGQETAALLRATLDELDHPRAKVNFDPANMLLYDKGDPIEAVRLLGKDIVHVHAKDATRPTTPGQWGREVPLGLGQVDMPKFIAALRGAGFEGTIAIEREVGNQEARLRDIAYGASVLRRLIA